jgi:hypothetical protein
MEQYSLVDLMHQVYGSLYIAENFKPRKTLDIVSKHQPWIYDKDESMTSQCQSLDSQKSKVFGILVRLVWIGRRMASPVS